MCYNKSVMSTQTPRKQTEEQFRSYAVNEIGVTPIEVTLTNQGVAFVFDNHDSFVKAYRYFKFGEGCAVAKVIETDFDEEAGHRFLTIAELR